MRRRFPGLIPQGPGERSDAQLRGRADARTPAPPDY